MVKKKSSLNPQQEKAVKLVGSPVLIFAGAGSGKTRVLTEKIAYLIEDIGIPPEHILSVTFTNKAANEMKERVSRLVSHDISKMSIGTFHSVCAGILRKHINLLGYDNSFTIYDQSDSKQLVKEVIKELDYDIKTFQPNKYQYLISSMKNKMIYPDDVQLETDSYIDKILTDIYSLYNKKLKENNAVDFDDMLLLPIELFNSNKSLHSYYQNKFQYVLVDEYQDTNKPQFEFIYMVSCNNNEITVVGDDDQSIYGWRGADISNILNFSSSFKNAVTVKLEQNYRSTQNILDAAYHVVSKNDNRAEKKLWTENKSGDLISVYEYDNERDEAKLVVNELLASVNKNNMTLNDIVLLYRTNTQSRVVEDRLRRESVPYHIVGGVKFYDRKEIKDMLAFMKYILNPSDTIAFNRIVNFPARGIGKTVTEKISSSMIEYNASLPEILSNPSKANLKIKQIEKLNAFLNAVKLIKENLEEPALHVLEMIIDTFKIRDFYLSKDNPEDLERLENIEELISSVSDFCERNENNTCQSFIEEVSLLTDIDRWNDNDKALTLMTLHSSKGLEFKRVYILGVEEGLIPLVRNSEDDDIEEERRLFYVGITRAIEKLVITYANTRKRYGASSMFTMPSSFLSDIPDDLISSSSTISKKEYSNNITPSLLDINKDDEFAVGDIVKHKVYGKGRIMSIEGVGDMSKISIQFRGNVIKKFVKKYANLKKTY